MSVRRVTEINCDGPACGRCEVDIGNAKDVRDGLRKLGWRSRHGKDYCPACVRDSAAPAPAQTGGAG